MSEVVALGREGLKLARWSQAIAGEVGITLSAQEGAMRLSLTNLGQAEISRVTIQLANPEGLTALLGSNGAGNLTVARLPAGTAHHEALRLSAAEDAKRPCLVRLDPTGRRLVADALRDLLAPEALLDLTLCLVIDWPTFDQSHPWEALVETIEARGDLPRALAMCARYRPDADWESVWEHAAPPFALGWQIVYQDSARKIHRGDGTLPVWLTR